jgi:hypothetical protein
VRAEPDEQDWLCEMALVLDAGVVTQINQILCGIPELKAYCNSRWSGILVSVLPPILLSVWQQVVLPLLFYWYGAYLQPHAVQTEASRASFRFSLAGSNEF